MNRTPPPGISPDVLVDVHEIAADWFIRSEMPTWTPADERELNAWLEADAFHREVFDSMGRTRQLFGLLKQSRTHVQVSAATQAGLPPKVARRGTAPRRCWWRPITRSPALVSTVLVMCVLLSAGGWYAWDNTPQYRLDMVTSQAEPQNLSLPDGSRIALNVGSSLRVRYYPRRREVVLNRGEAFFQVAADAARPFTVDAGVSQIKVVGTTFNVRAAPPRLVVSVLEGKVEVRPDHSTRNSPVLLLGALSGVSIDPVTGRYAPVAADADSIGDWRGGQLRFRHTALEDVVQDVSRYLGKPVTLASADLARLPVSGFFATAAPEAFLDLLPGLVPVRVQRLPDGAWLVHRR